MVFSQTSCPMFTNIQVTIKFIIIAIQLGGALSVQGSQISWPTQSSTMQVSYRIKCIDSPIVQFGHR